MPKHVTESTDAEITSTHQFTTGSLEIATGATFKLVVPTGVTGAGTTLYIYPKYNGVAYELVISTTAP